MMRILRRVTDPLFRQAGLSLDDVSPSTPFTTREDHAVGDATPARYGGGNAV